jgi:phosphopantothenoylcysteine decarboxylase/phosphopantothenate--cysteine ligase
MNVRMWSHEATRANVATLRARGVTVIEPDEGAMACGEYGPGRLPEPADILAQVIGQPGPVVGSSFFSVQDETQAEFAEGTSADLSGRHILITAGPTHEPIDPVRVIANRSSGRQGFAIAAAAARLGARVTLVAGPVSLPTPPGVARIDVETAEQMMAAVEGALPCDAAILVAAVADWKVEASTTKLKKEAGPPELRFSPNPDILRTLAAHPMRPALLVGFAAETDDLLANAAAKRSRKGADWIVANDVSGDVMGGAANHLHLVSETGTEDLGHGPKEVLARTLVTRIAEELGRT